MDSDARRSYTAEGVAALRAIGAREKDPARRNPDRLAERYLGGWMRWIVPLAPVRALATRVMDGKIPGIYPFVTARTRFFDAALLRDVDAGARQVVMLGAGADSRAHRFAERLSDVTVFELDHPATSRWKRRKASALDLPGTATYVPIDFGSTSLSEALTEHKVDRDARTVFLWEGVTPYLDERAVAATLTEIARFASGSSVVFDYLYRDALTDPAPGSDAAKYRKYLAGRGEPLTFTFDHAAMDGYLARYGLTVETHAHPDDLARDYLHGTGAPTSFSAMLHARLTTRA